MALQAKENTYEGRVGRTTRSTVLVTSDDGSVFPATVYRSIDTAADPDLLTKLGSGDLHVVTCPQTGSRWTLEMSVALHDPKRRVFALFVPSTLRHEAFNARRDLLEQLASGSEAIPAYVASFQTIFDAAEFGRLTSVGSRPKPVPPPAAPATEDLAASKELARQRLELEEEFRRLETERQQLDDVRERFDRERTQLDEAQQKLADERTRWQAERVAAAPLTAEALNDEAAALRAASGSPESNADESTQIVTDDQFIEVIDEEDVSDAILDGAQVGISDEVTSVRVTPLTSGIPRKFDDVVGPGRTSAVKISDGQVLAVAKLPKETIETVLDKNVEFFVQLHDLAGYPVVALTIATFDDSGAPRAAFGWALDVGSDAHRLILSELAGRAELRIGLYGDDKTLLRAVEIRTPFAANVEWALARADEKATRARAAGAKFDAASKVFTSNDFEYFGVMKHNFSRDSFSDANSPSEWKLAAGIVGYWSQPEMFDYLIGNRSFPLRDFRGIQERVVRGAAAFGIYFNAPLRRVAVEAGLAAHEVALAELLTANFAESCIAIRENDLEPAEQWENWDALLGLGEELGIPPDPEVVELAEVSLRRAQEIEELADATGPDEPTRTTRPKEAAPSDSSEGTLVVAKRSESTGVTYFLPADAVLDTFEDMAQMAQTDLELLLNDANGRLEAAQVLIDRFGGTTTAKVMEVAEKMNAAELQAMAKFLETKAGGLEGELVRAVESAGPSGAYLAARALSAVKSTTAIPALISAADKQERRADRERFAKTVAQYGEKLVPALSRAIKRDGPKEGLVLLLTSLEDVVEGTLSQLSKDRSKNLREAAREARQLRDEE